MVPTRFGETHIIMAGSVGTPALVLLHGAASNLLGWSGAIPEYSGDFRVIALDIPGEAGKSAPVRPSWNNDDYVRWLDDVLNATGTERAALLGISFGGWLAAKYATYRPERASKLAPFSPAGIAPARTSAIVKTILYSMQKEKGAKKIKRLVFGTGRRAQAHLMPRDDDDGRRGRLLQRPKGGRTAEALPARCENQHHSPWHARHHGIRRKHRAFPCGRINHAGRRRARFLPGGVVSEHETAMDGFARGTCSSPRRDELTSRDGSSRARRVEEARAENC